MGIKQAIESFEAAVDDLTTLEITTYTGTLAEVVDEDTGKINWTKFRPNSGVVLLAAATRVEPDFDTVNFRANHAGIDDLDGLYELHRAAVESAQAGRIALLELFKGVIATL